MISLFFARLKMDNDVSLVTTPISDTDILDLVDHKANLISYDKIAKGVETGKIKSIYDILGKNKACIILYLTDKDYGHWTCCFENDDGSIEFFDSYGYKPDGEFNFIPKHIRETLKQNLPVLTALLYAANVPIYFNEYHLQSSKPYKDLAPPATCGYWVATRLNFRDLDTSEFAKTFKDVKSKLKLDPDLMVAMLNRY
jgi:hypothetical protein